MTLRLFRPCCVPLLYDYKACTSAGHFYLFTSSELYYCFFSVLAAKGLSAFAISSMGFCVEIFIAFSGDKWPRNQVLLLDPRQHQTLLLGNIQKTCLGEKLMVNCTAKVEVRLILQISSVVFMVSFSL